MNKQAELRQSHDTILNYCNSHLAKVQLAVLEEVANDGGAVVDDHTVTDGDQLKIADVQRINVASLADAGSLQSAIHGSAPHPADKTDRFPGVAVMGSCRAYVVGNSVDAKQLREEGRTKALYHQVRKGVPRRCSANTIVVTLIKRPTCKPQSALSLRLSRCLVRKWQ